MKANKQVEGKLGILSSIKNQRPKNRETMKQLAMKQGRFPIPADILMNM